MIRVVDGRRITDIARLRASTDGGNALRVAAPRPGVLVLERQDTQFSKRYEAGKDVPADIDVLYEEGVVLTALKKCQMQEYGRELSQILRHARATNAGAMFLCLPSPVPDHSIAEFPYRFPSGGTLGELEEEKKKIRGSRFNAARWTTLIQRRNSHGWPNLKTTQLLIKR